MPESLETYRELTAACRAADNRRRILRGINGRQELAVLRNDCVLELFLLEKKIRHLVWWINYE